MTRLLNKLSHAAVFVLLAFGMTNLAAQTCGSPITLTPGTQQCANTSAGGDAFDSSCMGNYDGGDDYVFTYTTGAGDAGKILSITATGATTNDDYIGLAIATGCGDAMTCIANDGSSTDNTLTISAAIAASTTYSIVVSSFPAPQSIDFCLDAFLSNPPETPAATCAEANPLCGDALGQQYNANTVGTAEAGNDYGCLSQQPRPSWFYFQTETSGDIELVINNTVDLDFALWGPYPNIADAIAACGSLPAPVDCSYSAITEPEVAEYTGAAAGDVFVLLVTAYSAIPTTFTVTEGAGMTATTNCGILNCTAVLTETTPGSDFVYCNEMTGSTTVGMDANSGSGIMYTFDAGGSAGTNPGVAFVEICGDYDPNANTTPGDPTTNPNYTGFLVNDFYDYGTSTAAGNDPDLGTCDYITLVPITHIDINAVPQFIIDPTCFALGTPFIIDFYPEITATYDCGTETLTVDGGSPDDVRNPVAGEYTVAGDITGTTSGGTISTAGITADGSYNITVTDPSGCMQMITLTVTGCPTCPDGGPGTLSWN